MLGKKRRLTKKALEGGILAQQPLVCGGLRALFISKGRNLPSRFAVVVSKKVAKTAVMRNKLRRWIYSVLRTQTLSGFDVAIFVRTSYKDREILEKDVRELLLKIGVRYKVQ